MVKLSAVNLTTENDVAALDPITEMLGEPIETSQDEADDQSQEEQDETANEESDEQASQEEPATTQPPLPPIPDFRMVTIPTIPAEAETIVQLFARQDEAGNWRSGFRLMRSYACPPYEAGTVELPVEGDGDETTYHKLGDALKNAASRAGWWNNINQADDDPKASMTGDAIDAWREELDVENVTDSVFDAEEDIATATTAEATEIAQAADTTQAADTPSKEETKYDVTEDSQAAWDRRKAELNDQVARLKIQEVELKASLKAVREAMDDAAELLMNHIARGPERLPLIDAAANGSKTEDDKAEDNPTDPKPTEETETEASEAADQAEAPEPTAETESGDEAWRAVKIDDLELTDAIKGILAKHSIYTVGDWVDVPGNRGIEYTQLKGITEARLCKIGEAIDQQIAAL